MKLLLFSLQPYLCMAIWMSAEVSREAVALGSRAEIHTITWSTAVSSPVTAKHSQQTVSCRVIKLKVTEKKNFKKKYKLVKLLISNPNLEIFYSKTRQGINYSVLLNCHFLDFFTSIIVTSTFFASYKAPG